MLLGHVIVGCSWSLTVTNCWHVAWFPLVSVTVQVTVVFPCGKSSGALLLTLATRQLSPVKGVPRLTLLAVHRPESVWMSARFGGQVIAGGCVSCTVMLNVQLFEFPFTSVITTRTVLLPAEK